jgi:hypothetical protein
LSTSRKRGEDRERAIAYPGVNIPISSPSMTGFEPLIGIGTAALTGLVTEIVKTRGGKLLEQLDRDVLNPGWNQALKQYVETYTKRHGELKVVCVRMDAPIKLDEVYTAVQLLDRSSLRYFESAEALQELFRQIGKRGFSFEKAERQSGMEVANRNQYLMVLGGPGVGKSTFLRKIGLEALKGRKGEFQHACIPVFLTLKHLKDNESIEKFIADEFSSCGFPDAEEFTQAALKQGKLLLLLDGLDEVTTAHVDTAITQIENLVSRYSQNRFVASCRIAAYKGGFNRFKDVTMGTFRDDQIQEFIEHWFRSTTEGTNTAQQCWNLLQQNDYAATKELAQTPLLLTLICVVYDEFLELPRKRAELYSEALEIVIKKWAAEKRLQRAPIYQELNSKLELDLLAEIAYESFVADELFFDKAWVVQHIEDFLTSNLNAPKSLDGEDILKAIEVQQGVLVERARSAYSFSHLTLQEYLTAKYIVDNQETESVLENHLIDSRWREVILLVSGLIPGRTGVNNLLLFMELQAQKYINTSKLKVLLAWANQSVQGSEGNYKPIAKSIVAIYLILTLAHTQAQTRALVRVRTRARNLAFALDRTHSSNRIRSLDRVLDVALDFDRTLALDLDLALNLALDRAFEFQRIKIFRAVNFRALIISLESLETKASSSEPTIEICQAFGDQIRKIWFDAIYLPPELTTLSEEEIIVLEKYFYINELMVRCKEAAVRVSPEVWVGIEERMLKVP